MKSEDTFRRIFGNLKEDSPLSAAWSSIYDHLRDLSFSDYQSENVIGLFGPLRTLLELLAKDIEGDPKKLAAVQANLGSRHFHLALYFAMRASLYAKPVKCHRLVSVLARSVEPGNNEKSLEEIPDLISAVSQLGEREIRALHVMADAESSPQGEEFDSHCARLAALDLAAELPVDSAKTAPARRSFRLTPRGLRLLALLEDRPARAGPPATAP